MWHRNYTGQVYQWPWVLWASSQPSQRSSCFTHAIDMLSSMRSNPKSKMRFLQGFSSTTSSSRAQCSIRKSMRGFGCVAYTVTVAGTSGGCHGPWLREEWCTQAANSLSNVEPMGVDSVMLLAVSVGLAGRSESNIVLPTEMKCRRVSGAKCPGEAERLGNRAWRRRRRHALILYRLH